MSLRRTAQAVALAVCVAGCGPTTRSVTFTHVAIRGGSTIFGVGKALQLTASALYSDFSSKDVSGETTWTSSDPATASISTTGLVTGKALGTVKITATYQGQSASLNVVVDLPAATALQYTGSSSFESVGQMQQLTATASFNDGTIQDITAVAQWSSDTPAVLAVTPGGLATANGLGLANITVIYGSRLKKVTIKVTPPGTLVVSGFVRWPGHGMGESQGVAGMTVTNTVSGMSVLTDSQGNYLMAGLTPGTVLNFQKTGFESLDHTVTSEFDGVSVQALIRVVAGDPAGMSITENDTDYSLGGFDCFNCRLVRVVSVTGGTLHLQATSTKSTVQLSIWANGALQGATTDLAVGAGETVVYVHLVTGAQPGSPASITLATSLASPADRGVRHRP